MKNDTPYILSIGGEKVLHIGLKAVANSPIVIYEPVELFGPQIYISPETGPLILFKDKIWPVRAYDIPFSIDRIKSMQRYAANREAISIYPFERYLYDGNAVKLKIEPMDFINGKIGKPSMISQKDFMDLKNRVDIICTDKPNEYRFLASLG